MFIIFVSLASCGSGPIGVKGSTAWYATASKDEISKYEKENPGAENPKQYSGLTSLLTKTEKTSTYRSSSSSSGISSHSSTHQRIGNTIYSSDGTTHQQIGNTVFSSDGTTCQTIGNHTFCN